MWRELGYQTEGIERSPAGEAALAAGHVVHALDIETHELGLPRYDLISMTHVLEHLLAVDEVEARVLEGQVLAVEGHEHGVGAEDGRDLDHAASDTGKEPEQQQHKPSCSE